MKKIQLSLAIAAFAFGAFAFSPAPATASAKQTSYHWFSPGGTYLGFSTVAVRQTSCGKPGAVVCANGYATINNGQPQGSILQTTTKVQ